MSFYETHRGEPVGCMTGAHVNILLLIVPAIAHTLARTSPSIKFEIVKAIEGDPALVELIYRNLNEQLKKLIYDPSIRATAAKGARGYKIVINEVDECASLCVVLSLIRLILQSASNSSQIFHLQPKWSSVFYHHPEVLTAFTLHRVFVLYVPSL